MFRRLFFSRCVLLFLLMFAYIGIGKHMANITRVALESALSARQLDRTLTSRLPPPDRTMASGAVPSTLAVLDAVLGGGFPAGQLSEIAGPPSSGRTSVLLGALAAATTRGDLAALIDTCDRLDVCSAHGVALDRLLWIRGEDLSAGRPGAPRTLAVRALERAVTALLFVLHAGGFGLVALDLADVPASLLGNVPRTTWLRVQRAIEGSDTACLLVAARPLARSAGGVTVLLDGHGGVRWAGTSARSRHLTGLDIAGRVIAPRRQAGVFGAAR
ncbi:MAG: DNA recombination/repair protein RecA [Acidimicrobiia bacterium]|nr:DNA recombination/repair protein RecA [Acidimicrobiia bacterium]